MKKTIITLLTAAALAAPAFAADNAANQPQPQAQAQQSQTTQQQSQAQPQNGQQQNQNQASTQQPGSPNLNRGEVRQMQSALDKQGFNAARPDGKLGPKTRHAVQAFNRKKGIQSRNGQPTDQTLAQLGINTNQDQNQQPNGNGSEQQPSQNGQ
jgi:peptidoglycan hydrolase-like protein with peptidoglycan-binding domain